MITAASSPTTARPGRSLRHRSRGERLTDERLERIAIPKLFIAGSTDVQTPEMGLRSGVDIVSFAADAQAMFDASPWPKELAIVESNHRSSQLVTTAGKDALAETRSIIVRFLETYAWTSIPTPSPG